MPNVLAYAETRGGEARKLALETVTAARALADATGGEVHAVLSGAPGISALAEVLGRHGADVVLVLEHEALARFNAEALVAALAERLRAGGYRAAVFGASAHGRELAPRVGARLGVAPLPDVTSFELRGDEIVATHPTYAGKVITTLTFSGTPAVLSVRPNAFTPVQQPRQARVEPLGAPVNPAASRVVVTDLEQGRRGTLDLSEAPVVVSGGRGLKSAENFRLLEELAAAFGNAAVGATRAVTDEGWRPHNEQIGQTGRVVSPDLYLAVAISGAIQHLAGMRTARTIVAINRDREAPIFRIADYGIVGDVFEVVPALTEAVKQARQGH